MASSSSAPGIPADVYDIDCVPRFTDFTSPTLDHDETIGDKWFELQEQQLTGKETATTLCEQDENIPPVMEIANNSPEVAKLTEMISVASLGVQEENEPPVLEDKPISSASPKKKVPLVENARKSSPAHKKAVTISSEQTQLENKPPVLENKHKSPALSSKPPTMGNARKAAELSKKTTVASSSMPENMRKSPVPKKPIASSSVQEERLAALRNALKSAELSKKTTVASSSTQENMRKSPAPRKPVSSPSVQEVSKPPENAHKSSEPPKKTTIASSNVPENMRKSPAPKKPIASSSVQEEKKPPVPRSAPKSAELPKKTSVASSSVQENLRKSPAPRKPVSSPSVQEVSKPPENAHKSPTPKRIVASSSVQEEHKPPENAHKSFELTKNQIDSRHSGIFDDKKCAVRRTVVPQAFTFATDERIKRRSVSRDAVRSSVGPATPGGDRRLLPFTQGLRQYDKPTGSPARKPLTLPQPFHFHELKPREKKEDESQQPIIKSKPPVPPNAMRPSRAPMRAMMPVRPAVDEPKQEQLAVGRPRTMRRSVSATNVRAGGLQPFPTNSLNNGANSLRASLNGSASSLNNGVLDKVDQGATHGLPVIAKDRSRSRQRGSRR